MSFIFLCPIVVLALALSCPGGYVTENPLGFKNLDVYPEYRCKGDNITVEWSLSREDEGNANYGFTALITPPGYSNQRAIYNTLDNQGVAVVDINQFEIDNEITLPAEMKIEFVPKTNIYDQDEGREFRTVRTLYGDEKITRDAGRVEGQNYFLVEFPAPTWSEDIKVKDLKLITGCTNPLSGKYQYDKGPATPNPESLSESNNYSDSFINTPIQAQGKWTITPLDFECSKDVTTIKLEFTLFCPTP